MSSQNSTQNSATPGSNETPTSGEDGSQFPNLSQFPSLSQFSGGSFFRTGSAFSNWNPFSGQNQGPPAQPAQFGSQHHPGNQFPSAFVIPYAGNATYVGHARPLTLEVSQNYYQWSIDQNYGDNIYRPQVITTPHTSYGSVPDINIPISDLRFGTSAYEVHDMLPFPPKDKSTRSKATASKGKAVDAPRPRR